MEISSTNKNQEISKPKNIECRFIGESSKLSMYTSKIMLHWITKLLQSRNEESLQCLATLLSSLGEDLESNLLKYCYPCVKIFEFEDKFSTIMEFFLDPRKLKMNLRDMSTDEKETLELYRTVTSILNKLTAEKFDCLIEKFKNLPIDNALKLQGVIDLIFHKAIDEPGFCKYYAEMCRVLQNLKVPGKVQTFRILLISKCQQEFERNMAEELDAMKKQMKEQEIDDSDLDKEKEIQLLFEKMEHKVRRKSVGKYRFLGELFNLQMLTANIMLRCIAKLLSSEDEESLECLCKLLTTIGKTLELKVTRVQMKELESFFDKIQDLSENKMYNVSFKIRFMLQDIIDLKKNKWIPRRVFDKMNTECERQKLEMNAMNFQPLECRGSRTDYQKVDEWKRKTVGKNFKNNYKVDATKFNAIGSMNQTQIPDSVDPTGGFKQWSFGVAANQAGDKKSIQNKYKQPPLFSRNNLPSSSSNK